MAAPKIKAKAKTKAKALVSVLHSIRVGETLEQNIEGHAARRDSREFRAARATLQKIIATLEPNPYGGGPIQAHHGGSIWIYDGRNWRMVANWAGIEWSVQFCCDPAKVDALRQTARSITDAFPRTIPELEAGAEPCEGEEQLDVPALRVLLQRQVLRRLARHRQVFAQVSRSGTIRLKTGATCFESLRSAT